MKLYSRLLLFIFLSVILVKHSNAQAGQVDAPRELGEHMLISNFNQFNFTELSRNHFDKFADMLNVEGEFFLNEEWQQGAVYFTTKQMVKNDSIRYFVFGKEMHISHNGKTMAIINQTAMDSIVIDNHRFVYSEFYYGSKLVTDYLDLLSDKPIKLYKHYSNKFIKAKEVSGYQKQASDKYVIKEEYYISRENETPQYFNPSKRNVIALFANRKNEVLKYAKMNKLKFKNEDDLIRVFDYYGSLK
ncbi:MAG: hypothetical protein ACERIH_01200 [Labilibaculum antarcticum]